MNERIVSPTRSRGNSGQTLRTFGMLFLITGIAGKAIIEGKLLGNLEFEALLSAMNESDSVKMLSIIGVFAQLIQTCAIPLFAFLLVEGAGYTSCLWKYMLRVGGVALISEIPYDLVYRNKWMDFGSQNPVFAMLLGLIAIYYFQTYSGQKLKSLLINVLVAAVAIFWTMMLKIEDGMPIVLIITTLWFTRNRKAIQILLGCIVTCFCATFSVANLDYFFAPLVFLFIHFYNGEKGEQNRLVNYLAYPVLLMSMWLVARYAF